MSNKFASVKNNREVHTHREIQTQKHPGGRPKKSEEDKRSEKVFLTFTKHEKEQLSRLSDEYGLPLSMFIRKILKENGHI